MLVQDRDRRLKMMAALIHAVGLLSLVVGAFLYHFVVSTMVSQQRERNEREASRLERMVASKPQVEQEFRNLSDTLTALQQRAQTMRDGIPDEPREAEFLNQVTEAADQEKLKIRDFQALRVTSSASHSQLDVRLQGEGNYASICGFLQRVFELPRVKTVQRMWINNPSGGELYPLDLTLTLYFAAGSNAG